MQNFELFYQNADLAASNYKKSFGYVHNRSHYWWNIGQNPNCISTIISTLSIPSPSDDDDIDVSNFNGKIIKIKDLKTSTRFIIEWYNTISGDIIPTLTTEKYHGSGRFNVEVPNSINSQPYKDFAFRIYPKSDHFRSLGFPDSLIAYNLEQNNKVEIKLSPNPSHRVMVVISNYIIDDIQIIDINGKIIKSFDKIDESSYCVATENFPVGIYLMKIKSNEELVYKKFIRE